MQQIQRLPAKFVHESGSPRLRLQVFVVVRDAERRIVCLRTDDGWNLPGSLLAVNESPDDAARRIVATWFRTPLQLWLAEALNYPATGPEDDKWYLILVYEAEAPEGLAVAEHVREAKAVPAGEAPGPFVASQSDVFERLGA